MQFNQLNQLNPKDHLAAACPSKLELSSYHTFFSWFITTGITNTNSDPQMLNYNHLVEQSKEGMIIYLNSRPNSAFVLSVGLPPSLRDSKSQQKYVDFFLMVRNVCTEREVFDEFKEYVLYLEQTVALNYGDWEDHFVPNLKLVGRMGQQIREFTKQKNIHNPIIKSVYVRNQTHERLKKKLIERSKKDYNSTISCNFNNFNNFNKTIK